MQLFITKKNRFYKILVKKKVHFIKTLGQNIQQKVYLNLLHFLTLILRNNDKAKFVLLFKFKHYQFLELLVYKLSSK